MEERGVAEVLVSNQGWQCPVCQRVFAPWVQTCPNCPPAKSPVVIAPCTCDLTAPDCQVHKKLYE